jgi:acetylornithine deacetylase
MSHAATRAVSDALPATLAILERLVAFDTRNPPRAHTADHPVFDYLREQLAGFALTQWDHGDGSVTLLARRGAPTALFNYHLDTVPVAQGWDGDPFALRVDATRATGLGACDIKGALAAMLAAARTTTGDLAILVTTDEEAGNSRCVREYLATQPDCTRAFVAEPTQCRAVTAHRGILSGRIAFRGATGHASSASAVTDNAIHRAMNWGARAQQAVLDQAPLAATPLAGTRFNIGRIEGGVKPNMIASHVELGFNVRTAPAQDQQAVIDALRALADPAHIERFDIAFRAPPLPATAAGARARHAADALASRNGIEAGEAVDFWTEAALFSEAGMTAVVLGSGDIAQAHTANEWVALDQLARLHALYTRLIDNGIE